MERLRDALVRVKDGVWTCRAPVLLAWNNGPSLELAPGVVYEAGVRYRGVDVAAMLDDWLATGKLPPSVSLRIP
jgi:hypothetical protein